MKRVVQKVVILLIVLVMCLLSNYTYAATKSLNIQKERPYNDDDGDSTVGNDIYKIQRAATHTIFKIGEVNNNTLTFNEALYCARAALGFGDSESIGNIAALNPVTYTEMYNLKSDAQNTINYYNTTFSYNIDNTTTYTFSPYNAILWIIDNMYLPKNADAINMKAELLKNANITSSQLTDDDIEIVQQVAIWYFTNFDKNGEANSLSLPYTAVLSNLLTINDNAYSNDTSVNYNKIRAEQMDTLYKYFIDNAKTNASNYGTGTTRGVATILPTVSIEKTNPQITQVSSNVIIGPFELNAIPGNVNFSIDSIILKDATGKVIEKENSGVAIYNIVKNSTDVVVYKNTLEEVVNEGSFYIKIASLFKGEYDLSNVSMELKYSYDYYETTATLWIATAADQPVIKIDKEKKTGGDTLKIDTKVLTGDFDLEIKKIDSEGNLLTGATFDIETLTRIVVALTDNKDGTFKTGKIAISTDGENFTYVITEKTAPNGYNKLSGAINLKVETGKNAAGTGYEIKKAYFVDNTDTEITVNGVKVSINNGSIIVEIENTGELDLSLRKFITAVDGVELTGADSRVPKIYLVNLRDGTSTTAKYVHSKTPLTLKRGSTIEYTIRVYNEGKANAYATEITDYLPNGLTFVTGSTTNVKYGWVDNGDGSISTDYLKNALVKAYDKDKTGENITIWQPAEDGTDGLYYLDVKVECQIAQTGKDFDVLRNIAEITKAEDEDGNKIENPGDDRDSTPDNVDINNYNPPSDNSSYQEDDDDYEPVKIKPEVEFDLSLRKYIVSINGEDVTDRTPQIDTTNLQSLESGKTTAKYTHSKEPLTVRQGDIVTYTIRVYNEGEADGYAMNIADYIPEGLGFLPDYDANLNNGWVASLDSTNTSMPLVGTTGLYKTEKDVKNLKVSDFFNTTSLSNVNIIAGKAKITTDALKNDLIKAYDQDTTKTDIETTDKWQQSTNGTDGLYYRDIQVTCIVLAKNTYQGILRNIAEIAEDKAVNDNGDVINVDDRDSTPNNVDINNYNPPKDNSSYQEDDDDYEPLQLKYFDLALRKFITGVNETDVTTRVPVVSVDANGQIKYTHDKTPVYVENSDIVTYTIRVYNEGTIDGYAEEIEDDIPDGLEFLPSNSTNTKYGWKMYYYDSDKKLVETTDVTKATVVRTTYLSEANGKDSMLATDTVNPNLLHGYNSDNPISATNPEYRDIKIAFQVKENAITDDSRVIINKAQITDDSDDDEDSIPDEWNEGEDDQDKEYIYVRYFDLSLFKTVTKTIVTVDGKTTETETGFIPNKGLTDQSGNDIRGNDTNEPVAQVTIDKKKIKNTVVKFVYKIKVMNEGEISGYATEITDYIPEGLEFVAADNPLWTKVDDTKITTRALETTLLKPGESATVDVIFTWKNDANNLGLKKNIAAITEDYNDKNSHDVDSNPTDDIDSKKYNEEQQDDDDYALVILALKTGSEKTYTLLILGVTTIIGTGIFLIKKYLYL